MTEQEIWAEYYATPITPEGLKRRIELMDMLLPPQEAETPKENNNRNEEAKEFEEEKPPNADAEKRYYHGMPRRELELWIALREAGIIIDTVWHRGDPATGIRIRRIRLAAPIKCRPIPADYRPAP